MSNKDINIKHSYSYTNPTSGGGSKASSSDSPNLRQITDLLNKGLAGTHKKIAEAVIKAVMSEVKSSVKGSSTGPSGGSSISKSDIERLIKQAVSEIVKQTLTQTAKSYSKTSPGASAPNTDAVLKNIDKRVQGAMGSFSAELSKKGVQLDAGSIKNINSIIATALKGSFHPNLISSIKEVSSSLKNLQGLGGAITAAANAIKGMRASGGGFDVKELIPYLTQAAKVGNSVKGIATEISNLKSVVSRLPAEFDEANANLKTEIKTLSDAFKKNTIGKVANIRKAATDDPAKLAQLIATAIGKVLNSMPELKKSKSSGDIVRYSSDKNLPKLVNAIENLSVDVVQLRKDGLVSSIDTGGIDKAVSLLTNAISKIPAGVGKDAVNSAPFKKWAGELELVISGAKKAQEFVNTLKEIKDSNIELRTNVDKKSYNEAVNIRKELEKPIHTEVKLSVSDKDSKKIVGDVENLTPTVEVGFEAKGLDKFLGKNPKIPIGLDTAQAIKELKEIFLGKATRIKADIEGHVSMSTKELGRNQTNSRVIDQLVKVLDKLLSAVSVDTKSPASNEVKELVSLLVNKLANAKDDRKELRKVASNEIARNESFTGRDYAYDGKSKQITTLFDSLEKHFKDILGELQQSNQPSNQQFPPGMAAGRVSSNQQAIQVNQANTENQMKKYANQLMAREVHKPTDYISKTSKETLYGYKPTTILPEKGFDLKAPKKFIAEGEEARENIKSNVEGLAKSLMGLRDYMIEELSKNLKQYGPKTERFDKDAGHTIKVPKWKVVRHSPEQSKDEYFRLAEGYNKKQSGKQWSFQIADTDAIAREIETIRKSKKNYNKVDRDLPATELIKTFKSTVKNDLLNKNLANLGESVGTWLKRFSSDDISSWKTLATGDKKALIRIKKQTDTTGPEVSQEMKSRLGALDTGKLQNIYKETLGELEASKRLAEGVVGIAGIKNKLTRTIAVPAAKLTGTGAQIFETAQGSQRVIPKFAEYRTGFENLYKSLKDTGTVNMTEKYAERIRGTGLRPGKGDYQGSNKLAKEMLNELGNTSQEAKQELVERYDKASILRGHELQRTEQVGSAKEFKTNFKVELDKMAEKLYDGSASVIQFINALEEANVSAIDVVKRMETIEFQDIYQMFQKLLSGGSEGNSPLSALGRNPDQDRSVREYETYMNKLVGTIPIADPSRPRRYSHQEKIVNMMTMTSPIYEKGATNFDPDEQKQYIRDLNVALKDFINESKLLQNTKYKRDIPESVKAISTLGVPESSAGNMDEFRSLRKDENSKYLGNFNATNIKMYTDILPQLSPFGEQFQQAGRNIASTTNALAYRKKGEIGTEFPALRSERENQEITGGRYGDQGYGFNVIAELRNTANTFEDQIIISGKLADVLTSVTKTIVQPDALGRLDLMTKDGNLRSLPADALSVRDIKTRIKGGDAPQGDVLVDVMNKKINETNRIFQEVLGVPQKYRGRADKALIQDIQKAVTVVRGQDLNVQQAKIAETFFNYYGRKFTTRYGSKGVSVTPSAGFKDSSVLEAAYSKDALSNIKVLGKEQRETAGLGTAILPKSMGQLLSEVLQEARPYILRSGKDSETGMNYTGKDIDLLKQQLKASGSKFMMKMFTEDVGVVSKKSAAKQKDIFESAQKMVNSFGGSLEQGLSGIIGVKTLHKREVSGGRQYEEKPIDIRISSFGAAKRGLQTESLETIMNNVIGSDWQGSTTLKTKFDTGTYKSMLGTTKEGEQLFPSLSKYSKALGFQGPGKPQKEVYSDIYGMLEKRNKSMSKEELESEAKELTALEMKSSYYSKVIDEFGKSRKGFVGPKFVEIVEDPHANPAWSKSDIEKQIKGEKLNIPAYGAYSTIFGEDSAMMKEISSEIPLDARKHWEYLKNLQVLNTDTPELKQSLIASAQKVDIKDLNSFYAATGGFSSELPSDRQLTGTVLDTAMFPGAMDLSIPDTKDINKRESFYVPGALARATYPEPLIAGERGLDMVSRRLQQVVNAAKNLEGIISGAEIGEDGSTTVSDTKGRIKSRMTNLRKEAERLATSGTDTKGRLIYKEIMSDDEAKRLGEILSKLTGVLGDSKIDPSFNREGGTSVEYLNKVFNRRMGDDNIPQSKVYSETINDTVDQLIGLDPRGKATAPDHLKARYDAQSMLERKVRAGGSKLHAFAKDLGVTPATDDKRLLRAIDSLDRAKIDYYHTLAQTALGKTGSVQEAFFTRKIPAVMAKATTAVVDKTQELELFADALEDVANKEGMSPEIIANLQAAITKIDKDILPEHAINVQSQKDKGFTVLKQHELGVSEEYAKKIPANFKRRYAQNKSGDLYKLDEVQQGETLKDLLEYRKTLKTGNTNGLAHSDRMVIDEQLKNELTPQIESVRYPFTGTSSVQPYEAKLLEDSGDGRFLGKHTLMVPGVPEMDIDAFEEAKNKVENVITALSAQRESQWDKPVPDTNAISNLTDTINELNKAVSDVLPKYIAHQQKLDFDGDQIEIHSAKTAAARREIEQHYKKTTTFDKDSTSTAQVFRDAFTYDATKGARTTGEYVFAEQQMAFQKKFPKEEGFKFLENPFLTEGLEYLSSNQQLDILSNIPNAQGEAPEPAQVLENIARQMFRKEETVDAIISKIDEAESGTDKAANITELLNKLKELPDNIAASLEVGVREELYNAKYANTINAQLFKINTGQDTEGLNRVLKIFERNAGFGGGEIGGGSFNPTEGLEKRFPTNLNSLGDSMGNELNTMINELVRVGIQKGMDVKHAGETPIASEIVNLLSRGSEGLGILKDKIANHKSYGDLKEFSEANKKAMGIRLGGISTEDLHSDAMAIAQGRGDKNQALSLSRDKVSGNIDRGKIKSYITDTLGFEGFLTELSTQIQEAAEAGIIQEISRMSPTKRSKTLGSKSPEEYARKKVTDQIKTKGIDIKNLAEDNLMPLYQFRTSSASPYGQRGKYNQKYDDVPAPELEKLQLRSPEERKLYEKKFKEARATAKNLKDVFSDYSSYDQDSLGSYAMLAQSTMENLFEDQRKIAEINAQLKDHQGGISGAPIDRLLNKTNLPFMEKILDKPIREAYRDIEEYGRVVGMPSLSKSEQEDMEASHAFEAGIYATDMMTPVKDALGKDLSSAKIEEAINKKAEELRKKLALIDQLDRIVEVAQTKASEGAFLNKLFAKSDLSLEDKYQSGRRRIKQGSPYDLSNIPPGMGRGASSVGNGEGMAAGGTGGPSFSGGGPLSYSSGQIVPVHIHSIAENAGVLLNAGKGMAETTDGGNGAIPTELGKKIEEAMGIVQELTGGLNVLKDSDFGKKYRASQLKGKGSMSPQDFNDQVAEIQNVMTYRPDYSKPGDSFSYDNMTSSSLIGTGLHSRLEDRYKKELGGRAPEFEKPIKYTGSTLAGEISGTMDIITKDSQGQIDEIIDIKTISSKNFGLLKETVDRLKKETGAEIVHYQDLKKALEGKDGAKYIRDKKLDEVASQLNLYMASENKNAKATAHFYDNMSDDMGSRVEVGFGFEPDRLNRDMMAIAEARKRVTSEGSAFTPTGSFESAQTIADQLKINDPDPEGKKAERLIEIGREYLKTIQGPGTPQGMAAGGVLSRDNITKARAFKTAEMQGMDGMISARQQRISGGSLVGVHANLSNMQHAAKSFYSNLPANKAVALEGPDFESFGDKYDNTVIKDLLKEVPTAGPNPMAFGNQIKELQASKATDFSEMKKAWKAYRIASGDYYVSQMDKARKDYDTETDPTKQMGRYDAYEKSVNRFQKYVYRVLGQSSDPYTYNRQYVSPEYARGAGVFLGPDQLMDKASGPLGNDEKLNNVFKGLVGKKKGEAYPRPNEMVKEALSGLLGMKEELVAVYTDAEQVARMGGVIENAWDFSEIRENLARLKHGLMNLKKNAVFDAVEPETLEYYDKVYKRVKALEELYADIDFSKAQVNNPKGTVYPGQYGNMGIIKVPKIFNPNEQVALHARNRKKVEEYYKRPETMGGPKKGERFVYDTKLFGAAGQTISSHRQIFHKFGETVNKTGKVISQFSKSKMMDLTEAMHGSNRTFKVAIERVIKWGAAASLVYGGMAAIKDVISNISEVEVAMAQLQMVMNPLKTNFGGLQKSAVGFAKQYGVEVTDVLKGMKVFAQQGLGQDEVIDRTQTSTLASNVSTLNATDATEALTAAMRVFSKEGESSIQFLDAWSEVESKAAITSGNLADAIKKAASAGKNAGFTFHQLNGMVAAVGATTRQTGKEVGTSLRFIFRRLTSEKGPRELAKLNINTLGEGGDIRPGFDILGDLANKWKDLGSAQKLSIAQAIGGTRQYNQVLVLMDQWDEVLRSVTNSTNSKGSAERKNMKLMETYAKQVEQLKAVFSELQIDLGKIALPIFKTGVGAMKGLLETVAAIPTPIKAAATAMATLFAYTAKGAPFLDKILELSKHGSVMAQDFSQQFNKGLKIGQFEVFGKGNPKTDSDLKGLNTIGKLDENGILKGNSMYKFQSAVGKSAFLITELSKRYNEFLFSSIEVGGDAGQVVAGTVRNVAQKIDDLLDIAFITPGKLDDVVAVVGNAVIKPMKYVAQGTEWVSKNVSKGAGKALDMFAAQNTGLIKSLAPLMATGIGGAMLFPSMSEGLNKLTQSAEEYRDKKYDIISAEEDHLLALRGLQTEYDVIDKQLKNSNSLANDPKKQMNRLKLGTYESPILEAIRVQEGAQGLSNNISKITPQLVAGYDEFGNAIVNTSGNLREYLEILEQTKSKELALEKIDVASKFIESLTKSGGSEKFKEIFKSVIEEFPVIGKLFAKEISVTPRQALNTLSKQMNTLVTSRNATPLSTAFDKDIAKLEGSMAKLRATVTRTVKDIKKTLEDIDLVGQSPENIVDIFSSPELRKGYELLLNYEVKYNIKATKDAADIGDLMGAQIMTGIHSRLKPIWEAIPKLTMERVKEMGITPFTGKGTEATISSGDVAVFSKDFADKYNIAGRQALIKVQDADNLMFEYFDKAQNKLVKKDTKTFSEDLKATGLNWHVGPFNPTDVNQFVEAIIPTKRIIESAEKDIATLNAFVIGASAGLSGLSPKTLKEHNVGLGERFYSDISTQTLIQTDKGYNPTDQSFGVQQYKVNYSDEFKQYFSDPVEKYGRKMEELKSLSYEGIELDEAGLATALKKELTDMQNIIKNNQAVFQFRAVHEELNKTLEAGTRTLQQNLNLEKQKLELDKNRTGILKGVSKGLESLPVGNYDFNSLSTQQLALRGSKRYTDTAKQVQLRNVEIEGGRGQLLEIEKAIQSIKAIDKLNEGFGNKLDKSQRKVYMEIVDIGGTKVDAKMVLQNDVLIKEGQTTNTNLEQIISKMDGPTGRASMYGNRIDKDLNSIVPNKREFTSFKDLSRMGMERAKAVSSNDIEAVAIIDKAMDQYASKIANELGTGKALKAAKKFNKNEMDPFVKAISNEEFTARLLRSRNVGADQLIASMEKENKAAGNKGSIKDSNAYKNWQKAKSVANKESLIDSKELIKAATAAAVYSQFAKKKKSRTGTALEEKAKNFETMSKVERGADNTDAADKLDKQAIAARAAAARADKMANVYGVVQASSGIVGGSMMLAKTLGVSEGSVKGTGAAALGTYGLVKLIASTMGTELPAYINDFGDQMKPYLEKLAKGDKTVIDDAKFAFRSSSFLDKFKAMATRATGTTAEEAQAGIQGSTTEMAANKQLSEINKLSDTYYEQAKTQIDSKSHKTLQLVVSGLVAAFAGQMAKQSDTRNATLSKAAQKEAVAFQEILAKFSKTVGPALDRLSKNKNTIRDAGFHFDGDKANSPLTLDVNKERDASLQELGATATAIKKKLYDLEKIQIKEQDQIDINNLTVGIEKTIVAQLSADKAAMTDLFVNKRLVSPISIGGGLEGYGGDQTLPLFDEELSSQQRVFKNVGAEFKKNIETFELLSKKRSTDLAMGQIISKEVGKIDNVLADKNTSPVVATAMGTQRQKLLQLYKDIAEGSDKSAIMLEKFGTGLKYLTSYSDALKNFNAALKDVSVNAATRNLKGMSAYHEATDKMVGGSHPEAAQKITFEQQRMGVRTGIPLYNRENTTTDIRRSQLLDKRGQWTTDDYMQFITLDRQNDRDVENYRADKEDSYFRESMKPYEDYTAALQRVKFTQGVSPDEAKVLDNAASSLSQAMVRAPEWTTLGGLKDQLWEDRRDKTNDMSYAEWAKERERLNTLSMSSPDGDDTELRRELPGWLTDRYKTGGKFDSRITKSFQDMPSLDMKEMQELVTNPITERIDLTNELLSAQAEKLGATPDNVENTKVEFGGAEEPGWLRKFINAMDFSYGDGKAAGGIVRGPGGPKEDKVPTMLSPGEYVIRAAAAQKLGYAALEAMNNQGAIPGFAEGGTISKIKDWVTGFGATNQLKKQGSKDMGLSSLFTRKKKKQPSEMDYYNNMTDEEFLALFDKNKGKTIKYGDGGIVGTGYSSFGGLMTKEFKEEKDAARGEVRKREAIQEKNYNEQIRKRLQRFYDQPSREIDTRTSLPKPTIEEQGSSINKVLRKTGNLAYEAIDYMLIPGAIKSAGQFVHDQYTGNGKGITDSMVEGAGAPAAILKSLPSPVLRRLGSILEVVDNLGDFNEHVGKVKLAFSKDAPNTRLAKYGFNLPVAGAEERLLEADKLHAKTQVRRNKESNVMKAYKKLAEQGAISAFENDNFVLRSAEVGTLQAFKESSVKFKKEGYTGKAAKKQSAISSFMGDAFGAIEVSENTFDAAMSANKFKTYASSNKSKRYTGPTSFIGDNKGITGVSDSAFEKHMEGTTSSLIGGTYTSRTKPTEIERGSKAELSGYYEKTLKAREKIKADALLKTKKPKTDEEKENEWWGAQTSKDVMSLFNAQSEQRIKEKKVELEKEKEISTSNMLGLNKTQDRINKAKWSVSLADQENNLTGQPTRDFNIDGMMNEGVLNTRTGFVEFGQKGKVEFSKASWFSPNEAKIKDEILAGKYKVLSEDEFTPNPSNSDKTFKMRLEMEKNKTLYDYAKPDNPLYGPQSSLPDQYRNLLAPFPKIVKRLQRDTVRLAELKAKNPPKPTAKYLNEIKTLETQIANNKTAVVTFSQMAEKIKEGKNVYTDKDFDYTKKMESNQEGIHPWTMKGNRIKDYMRQAGIANAYHKEDRDQQFTDTVGVDMFAAHYKNPKLTSLALAGDLGAIKKLQEMKLPKADPRLRMNTRRWHAYKRQQEKFGRIPEKESLLTSMPFRLKSSHDQEYDGPEDIEAAAKIDAGKFFESFTADYDARSWLDEHFPGHYSNKRKGLPIIGRSSAGKEQDKKTWMDRILKSSHASGGRLFGAGGTTDDQIPAFVSPGEYIFNAKASRGIGYQALDYMNKKGKIPRFSIGGEIGRPTTSFMESMKSSPATTPLSQTTKVIAEVDPSSKIGVDVGDAKVGVDVGETKVGVDVGDAKVGVDVSDAKVGVDIGDAKIGVDTADAKVGVDVSDEKVGVDTEGAIIKIDTEGVMVGVKTDGVLVGVDTDGVSVSIDTSALSSIGNQIGSDIASSIEGAAAALKTIKLSVDDSASGGSAGAAKFDQLAKTVEAVQDKFLTSSVKFEEEVVRLEGRIDSNQIQMPVDNQGALNNVTSQISRVEQSIATLRTTQDIQISNATFLAQQALSARNTI